MKEGKAAFGRLFFVLLNTNQRKLIAVLTLFAYVATAFTVKIPWSTALLAGFGRRLPSTRITS
jgi:hypothetical protein